MATRVPVLGRLGCMLMAMAMDAASTAFYGMRGGNGVILITTRQE